jgi:nicotinamidase/pyrazinamidase
MATYDPSTALAIVDIQNDFADPVGSLYVSGGEDVVGVANSSIREAREAGAHVVYTQDWHPPTTPHFAKDGGVWPVHCVRDTWGAAFHPGLDVAAEATVVRKGTAGEDGYSGFTVADPGTGKRSSTSLESILRERRIERLVVVGLATDYCVKETAIDGERLGFEMTVVRRGVRAVDLRRGDGDAAFDAMRDAGVTLE